MWCFVFDIYQMWQVYGASLYFGQYRCNVSTRGLVMIKTVVRNGSRFVNVAGRINFTRNDEDINYGACN